MEAHFDELDRNEEAEQAAMEAHFDELDRNEEAEQAAMEAHFDELDRKEEAEQAAMEAHFDELDRNEEAEQAAMEAHFDELDRKEEAEQAAMEARFDELDRKQAAEEAAMENYLDALTSGDPSSRIKVKKTFHDALDKGKEAELAKRDSLIRLEERNKVISELSHHIKNLNATVREPLENLRNQPGVPKNILEDALRGTNLIRNIVNAMNLSIGGAKEDFVFDATHLDDESTSLESIIWSALFSAIPNMFDGKHFSKFLRNYFPTREVFREAQSAWGEASASGNLEKKVNCLRNHFFDLSVEISGDPELVFGDTKGSATKMLILCQEIMMNAVKYASTMERENRDLRISVLQNKETVSIAVANSCNTETRLKTAGLGHTVIKNFAKILGCEPQIIKTEDRYALSLAFDNFSHITPGADV